MRVLDKRRALAVGYRDNLRALLAGKTACLNCALRVARKAHRNQQIAFSDVYHLLVQLGCADASDEGYVIENKAQIVVHKVRQNARGHRALNINPLRTVDDVNRVFKALHINVFERVTDFLDILIEHARNRVLIAYSVAGDVHTLNSGQAVFDVVLQGALELRISLKAKLNGKAHNRGLAHANGFSELQRRHISSFFVMLQNKVCNQLLTF